MLQEIAAEIIAEEMRYKPEAERSKSGSDCGANAEGGGGFQPGNTCGREDGAESGGERSEKVLSWAKEKFKDEETAKNFAEWFKGSKVVDEKGEPLTVYHGTNADFTEFGDSPNKGSMGESVGHSFTTNREFAQLYAGESGKTKEFYLKADKVLSLDKYTTGADLAKKLNAPELMKIPGFPDRAQSYWFLKDGEGYRGNKSDKVGTEVSKRIRQLGYEAVSFPEADSKKEGITFVVFSPNQIKSATENSGRFDPSNPDITKAAPSPKRSRKKAAPKEKGAGRIKRKKGS
jgi:hypothetical protein